MDIHTLTVFITLADQLHFRKTSDQHHMTPSALTRAIQRLEHTLGASLFDRNKRSVSLTDTGHHFYEFARQTITAYDALQGHVHSQTPDQLRGSIKIYSTVTAAYSIMPDLVKRFRDAYPLVMTYLETGVAKGGYSRLASGDADFAIGIITYPHHQDLLCKKILETPLVFVVPKPHSPQNIQGIPLIFPEQGDLATIITGYLKTNNLPIQVHSYVEGHEAILAMVAAGLGGAVLPQIVIDYSHLKDSITVIPLQPPLPSLEVGVFVKKSALASPIKRAFWDRCQP